MVCSMTKRWWFPFLAGLLLGAVLVGGSVLILGMRATAEADAKQAWADCIDSRAPAGSDVDQMVAAAEACDDE